MTQIANLPQIDGTRTSFSIVKNAAFAFSIAFPAPYGAQAPLNATAGMTAGSPLLINLPSAAVAVLITGQPVAGYGLPLGTTVASIVSSTSVMVSTNATQSGSLVNVTFQPLPLDITGISFLMQIRASAIDPDVLLSLSTDNGRLLNGTTTGILSALIDPASDVNAFGRLPLAGGGTSLVTDIVASASDGPSINLMAQSGPASVTVQMGVSRP